MGKTSYIAKLDCLAEWKKTLKPQPKKQAAPQSLKPTLGDLIKE